MFGLVTRSLGLRRVVNVARITTGQGQSELGFEFILNEWDDVDIPNLKWGDELVVYVRRKRKRRT